MPDIPREQHPRNRSDSGEQHQRDADAIGSDEIIRAESWNPRQLSNSRDAGGWIEVEECVQSDRKSAQCDQQGRAADQRQIAAGDEHH